MSLGCCESTDADDEDEEGDVDGEAEPGEDHQGESDREHPVDGEQAVEWQELPWGYYIVRVVL